MLHHTFHRTAIVYSINRLPQLAQEVVKSASITKSKCPDWVDFILYSSFSTDYDPIKQATVFDKIIIRNDNTKHTFEYRISSFINAFTLGYDRILFLDSDAVFINERAYDVFELLDNFDIAVAHAPARIVGDIPDVPQSFPEFNCGVVVAKNNRKVRRFFEEFLKTYTDQCFNHPHDQGAFRYTLYYSNLRIATLPPEYNNRSVEMLGIVPGDCLIWHNRIILNGM